MELILKETISSLGREGDVVTVKDGYGRNYLLPQGKAMLANEQNLAILARNRAAIEAKLEKEQKLAEKTAKKISALNIEIEQLAGDDERLFGSVTNADICEKLADLNVNLDKRQILLTDPIKTLGETKVQVKVGFQMTAEITVKVVPLQAKE
ncbi:50S ribosomal protein L9 [Desulfomarina profundi]|uniref:Large ribosomal subunit protein bL9 n=1 Tax=Desulfomarina profundi TaxID=2772557 RepID=A0A8D5FT06_9BACT|nr:50S ribosomal protein L9 [Desulfomarina profundi]BCL60866.1 50S ribosomal protein L9 [Desulfomarina profundi]